VAVQRPGASTQLLHEEDKGDFVDSPLGFGVFFENFKNSTQLRCFVNQTCSKNYEEGQGPSCKY
jgi:hypothetical protein